MYYVCFQAHENISLNPANIPRQTTLSFQQFLPEFGENTVGAANTRTAKYPPTHHLQVPSASTHHGDAVGKQSKGFKLTRFTAAVSAVHNNLVQHQERSDTYTAPERWYGVESGKPNLPIDDSLTLPPPPSQASTVEIVLDTSFLDDMPGQYIRDVQVDALITQTIEQAKLYCLSSIIVERAISYALRRVSDATGAVQECVVLVNSKKVVDTEEKIDVPHKVRFKDTTVLNSK